MNQNQKVKTIKIVLLLLAAVLFYALLSPGIGEVVASFLLFSAVLITGLVGSIIVGILVPVLAGLFNLLSPELSEVMLYLVIGNILLVTSYYYINKIIFDKKSLLAVFMGFFIAAILRAIPVTIYAYNLEEISQEMRNALGFPQFFSALLGGVIFFFLFIILRKLDMLSKFR
ncbi:MAG: hypothetical protein ACOCV3_08150, partial [Halanaerobiales bacterium]